MKTDQRNVFDLCCGHQWHIYHAMMYRKHWIFEKKKEYELIRVHLRYDHSVFYLFFFWSKCDNNWARCFFFSSSRRFFSMDKKWRGLAAHKCPIGDIKIMATQWSEHACNESVIEYERSAVVQSHITSQIHSHRLGAANDALQSYRMKSNVLKIDGNMFSMNKRYGMLYSVCVSAAIWTRM